MTANLSWGDFYRALVDKSGASVGVAKLPANAGGFYAGRDNSLTVSSLALNEDRRTVATILAHELTHAAQALIGDNPNRGCVDAEVEAHRHQIVAWVILYDGLAPGRTERERIGNYKAANYFATGGGDPWLYKYVVDIDEYQDECRLWAP